MAERDRRRRRTALLASLLFHAALLAPLFLVAPRLPTAPAPNRATMVLGLVPEARLGIATPQVLPSRTSAGRRAPIPASSQPVARPALQSSPTATARPVSSPHATPSAAAAAPAGDSGASASADNGANQDAVRRALRAALACAPGNAQNLDEDARATCRKRLSAAAVAMGDAKVDTIPPLKRAYFDAVQKAYQDIRHYPTPDTQLTHLPGAASMYDQRLASIPGHPPHAGCGLKFGGPKDAAPTRAPPHSLFFKLGPLICGVTPPQGVLTEESATPNADDVP